MYRSLLTLVLGAAWLTAAHGASPFTDEETRHIVTARRSYPRLVRDATAHGVFLDDVLLARRFLRLDLGDEGDQRRYQTIVVRPRSPKHSVLTLAELNPDLAVFKGLFGHDCSSELCFGGPYAPGERVFAILDHRDQWRGYVSVSKTMIEGRGAYYVNSINGRRVGPEQTLMVIAGLRALLGGDFAQLALPPPKTLKSAVNFRRIRVPLRRLIDREPDREQGFPDHVARAKIDRQTKSHYERMTENALARLIPAGGLRDLDFSTEVHAGSRFANIEAPEISTLEFNLTLVEAICSYADSFADIIWFRAGGGSQRLDEMTRILLNSEFEPRDVHLDRVTRLLAELRIPNPRQFIAANADLFTPGAIVAAESMTPAHRSRTIALLLKHYGRHRTWPRRAPITRWLRDLSADARKDLIVATVHSFYVASKRKSAARDLYQITLDSSLLTLLVDIVTPEEFVAFALDLSARGLHWGEIIEALVRLERVESELPEFERAGRLAAAAIADAPGATELVIRARDILSAPSRVNVYLDLDDWIDRFMSLNPGRAEVEAMLAYLPPHRTEGLRACATRLEK